MIRLFDRDEMDFNHNETVLTDVISAEVEHEGNGLYELILEYPRNDFARTLSEGKIIQAPTPKGDQLFRIYKPVKNLKTYTIYARHIFYDLLNNFLESVKPTQQSGEAAIQNILSSTQFTQRFIGSSDIMDERSAYYVRMNPVQALLGADNSFVNVWGGELVRDNFTFRINARGGFDNGYEVRLGKNLLGVEVDIDESNVYTRIYPSVVIEDNKVTVLPEKYVDSPLIESYEQPHIVEERIDLTDEQKELPLEDIYTLMRDHCAALFEDGIDKPAVNYKVDFIELSKTEQYKNLQVLEKVDMYDDVTTIIPELDVDVKARVMRYKYDALKKRYIKMELGNFKDNLSSQLSKVNKKTNQIYNELDRIENTIQVAANGKNAVHRGPDEPFATAVGDLWYKPIGDGEVEMYQWNGTIWELVVSTAINAETEQRLTDAKQQADTAKQNADDIATDLEVGTSFYKHADDIGLASKNADGSINSIINLGSDGTAYIGGKNIVLDGDTVVDGTFTVTDELFAPNMSIDKFTTGTLNAAEVNIINMNVDNLVGNTSTFVKSAWNDISSNLSIDGSGLSIARSDGSRNSILSVNGYEFWMDGGEHGRLSILNATDASGVFVGKKSVSLAVEDDSYISLSYRKNATDDNFTRALGVDGATGRIYFDNIFPSSGSGNDGLAIKNITDSSAVRIRHENATYGVDYYPGNSVGIIGDLLVNDIKPTVGASSGIHLSTGTVSGHSGIWLEDSTESAGIFFANNGYGYLRIRGGVYSLKTIIESAGFTVN